MADLDPKWVIFYQTGQIRTNLIRSDFITFWHGAPKKSRICPILVPIWPTFSLNLTSLSQTLFQTFFYFSGENDGDMHEKWTNVIGDSNSVTTLNKRQRYKNLCIILYLHTHVFIFHTLSPLYKPAVHGDITNWIYIHFLDQHIQLSIKNISLEQIVYEMTTVTVRMKVLRGFSPKQISSYKSWYCKAEPTEKY